MHSGTGAAENESQLVPLFGSVAQLRRRWDIVRFVDTLAVVVRAALLRCPICISGFDHEIHLRRAADIDVVSVRYFKCNGR